MTRVFERTSIVVEFLCYRQKCDAAFKEILFFADGFRKVKAFDN